MLNLWILLVTLAASPEGTLAVTVGAEQEQRQIHLVDVETGTWQVAGEGKGAGAPVWSPDGEWIAYAEANSTIAIMRSDGSDRRVLDVTGTPTDWGPKTGEC